jgi:hypothetical protein
MSPAFFLCFFIFFVFCVLCFCIFCFVVLRFTHNNRYTGMEWPDCTGVIRISRHTNIPLTEYSWAMLA